MNIKEDWEDLHYENEPKSFDERFILKIWRLCKIHWEFIAGLIIGIMVITLIVK